MHDPKDHPYANHALGRSYLPGAENGVCEDARAMATAKKKPVEVTRETMAAACMLAQRVEDVVNEIAGHRKTVEGKGSGSPIGSAGILPELADQAHEVAVIINSAHAALDRLREVI